MLQNLGHTEEEEHDHSSALELIIKDLVHDGWRPEVTKTVEYTPSESNVKEVLERYDQYHSSTMTSKTNDTVSSTQHSRRKSNNGSFNSSTSSKEKVLHDVSDRAPATNAVEE